MPPALSPASALLPVSTQNLLAYPTTLSRASGSLPAKRAVSERPYNKTPDRELQPKSIYYLKTSQFTINLTSVFGHFDTMVANVIMSKASDPSTHQFKSSICLLGRRGVVLARRIPGNVMHRTYKLLISRQLFGG